MCSHEDEVEAGAAPGREDETTPRQREEIPGGYRARTAELEPRGPEPARTVPPLSTPSQAWPLGAPGGVT